MVGRIAVTALSPTVSCGSYSARAVTGQTVLIGATVFREGHDAVAADVVVTDPAGKRRAGFLRMQPGAPGTDRWSAPLVLPDDASAEGLWSFSVEGWSDPLGTWWHDAPLKIEAGVDVDLMLEEGAILYDRAGRALPKRLRPQVVPLVPVLRDAARPPLERLSAAMDSTVVELLSQHPLREMVTPSEPRTFWVDRARALFGAWYEFFPRSEGAKADASGVLRTGTLRTAMERLPAVAAMGFDVVYLPPIHPIGKVNRKGPNNTLTPGPNDVGSPWAIGSDEGGHDAVHPDLGTLEDFDAFVARTVELGMEVALDLALQCAPDHPWAKEHPEWFTTRLDGTIAYAENPPKKYQDIYPLNFDHDPEGLYAEVLRVVRHWTSHGVRVFRVDNPHTKPLPFWEWLIAEVKKTEPDVLFLAEAFTRRAMMHELARIGFTQSYTYFTWRTLRTELEEYMVELVEASHYMRPNFFVNTPTSCTPRCSTAGPRCSRSGRCSQRCCRRATASTPATSCTSMWRSSRAARSTSTARSTSSAPGTGHILPSRRWRRTSRCSTGCATSIPRSGGWTTCTCIRSTRPTSWPGARSPGTTSSWWWSTSTRTVYARRPSRWTCPPSGSTGATGSRSSTSSPAAPTTGEPTTT